MRNPVDTFQLRLTKKGSSIIIFNNITRDADMGLKYEITIPEKVAKLLGLSKSGVGSSLKKNSLNIFSEKSSQFWSGKTTR